MPVHPARYKDTPDEKIPVAELQTPLTHRRLPFLHTYYVLLRSTDHTQAMNLLFQIRPQNNSY